MKKTIYDGLVAAGTTEAALAAAVLDELHLSFAASVATPLGRKMLDGTKAHILEGRLDRDGFERLIGTYGFRFVIDATHPFAVEVSKNLKAACENKSVPYIRYVRRGETYDYNKIIRVPDAYAAAKALLKIKGNLLLTTGANTAHIYKAAISDFNERVYIRVLDTDFSRERCQALGIRQSHIIAQNPPFSEEANKALIEKFHIAALVTKDSGASGGLEEKINSARAFHIPVVLIQRPESESGVEDTESLKKWLKENTDICI